MIDFRISSSDLEAAARRFASAPRIVEEELRRGVQEAQDLVYRAVYERTPEDTGRLRGGLERFSDTEGSSRITAGVEFRGVPYARFVEQGTRAHRITPKRGKVLRFVVGGKVLFRPYADHPGTRGVHMLTEGARAAGPGIRRVGRQMQRRIYVRLASGR
jgi:hypothetical protein